MDDGNRRGTNRGGIVRVRRCKVEAGIIAVLLSAVVLLAGCGGGEAPEAAEPVAARETRPVLVRTATPEVETVVDRADLAADVVPLRRATLAAEVPGTVDALAVEEGQRVRRGQEIARIDTRALEQAVAEAEALFRQADAQHTRARKLFERRSITKKDLEDAITGLDVAGARLASARLELEKSKIRAPWSGRVTEKHAEVGDYVLPGQPVVELVDVSRVKVEAPAPASDVPYLETGVPATVVVDALPGETFEGRVTRLAAELDPGARTLEVEVEIPNPEGKLKPGMLARMEIPRRTLEDALLVPLEAVVDLGERRVVYVVEEGVARRRTVELGPVVGERVVVASGLSPGDRVIVEGTASVAGGQRVREADAPGVEAPALEAPEEAL